MPSARMKKIYVGVARLGLHIPEARSLKEKRSHTRSLAERLRARHQVMVLETDHQDLHQRAELAVIAVSTDVVDLEARLQRVSDTIDRTWTGHILDWEVEIIET
jgi:uncharacterized protein YlxP (DUF503 family)